MTTVPTSAPTPEERVFRLKPEKPLFLTEKEIRWRKARLLIGAIVAMITVVLVILVSFVFPARVYGQSGFTWTQRAPLAAGLPSVGNYVLLSDELGGLRSNTRIFESLARQHSIVRIAAVPGDELTYQGDTIAVNGVATDMKASITGGSRLSASYLVVCEVGNCKRGEVFTAPSPNVLGEVAYDPVKAQEDRLKAEQEATQTQQ